MKKIITAIVLGVAVALFSVIAMQPHKPTHLSELPKTTVFQRNIGKYYTPVSVKGYESVADYPDEFLVPEGEFSKVEALYNFPVKQAEVKI